MLIAPIRVGIDTHTHSMSTDLAPAWMRLMTTDHFEHNDNMSDDSRVTQLVAELMWFSFRHRISTQLLLNFFCGTEVF